jgi:23S rRNA (pseudouridine1915-N3)-methyltransferase
MNIKIICLGKTKQDFIKKGVDEYVKRISRFGKLTWIILPDVKLTNSNTPNLVKAQESAIIKKKLNPRDYIIALDEYGKQLDSINFAKKLEAISISGKSITFIIGGVYGLHSDILKLADLNLSFSKLTFTHQMIRLLISEQIYRAFTILNNKTYHY